MLARLFGGGCMVRRWAAAVVVMLVVTACGGSQDGAAGEGGPGETGSPPSSGKEISGLVEIGAGRKVFVECKGAGSPTVVFESGDTDDHRVWSAVVESVSVLARTCTYDRLGNGVSSPASGCRRLKDLRGDLEALLRTVGETGPYVLVGTSGGGFLMAGFAYAHPKDTAGLVLVETPRAIIPERAPPGLLADLKCDSPENRERRDYVAIESAAWTSRRKIGDIPMSVISNDYGKAYSNAEERTNVADQKGWFLLSPQARQVIVTSGHAVPQHEPDVVVKEIDRVLDAAR